MSGADHLALAERFFTAIEAGDLPVIESLYAPGAVVWHNHDGVEQGVEENLRVLGWMVRHLDALRYDVRHRVATEDGFVQQHTLHARGPSGDVAIPACLVVRVVAGRVARIDEYLDSAHLSALLPSR